VTEPADTPRSYPPSGQVRRNRQLNIVPERSSTVDLETDSNPKSVEEEPCRLELPLTPQTAYVSGGDVVRFDTVCVNCIHDRCYRSSCILWLMLYHNQCVFPSNPSVMQFRVYRVLLKVSSEPCS